MSLRMTFYDYKIGDDGNRIPIAKTIGGSKPRYSMKIKNNDHFEGTKNARKEILNQYLLSESGEGIKNISVLQRSVPVVILGARRKVRGNKTTIKKKTLKYLLPIIEDMSYQYKNDSLAKSILASIVNGLRVDNYMCKMLGMVGGKQASNKDTALKPIVHTYKDLIDNVGIEDRRMIELYIDLFDLRRDGEVDVNE